MKKLQDIKNEVLDAIYGSSSQNDAIKKINDLGYDVSVEELEALLKGNVKQYQLNDEQLEMVAGGTEWYDQTITFDRSKVKHIFKVGDHVEVASGFGFGTTVACEIKELGVGYFSLANGGNAYFDTYYCENIEYTWYFYDGWKTRDLIEKK